MKDESDFLIDTKSQLDKRHILDFAAEHEIPQEILDKVMDELNESPNKFIEQLPNGEYAYAHKVQVRMYELNQEKS